MKAYWVANYTEIKDTEIPKKYPVKAKEAVEKCSKEYVEARKNLENNVVRENIIFEGM